MSLYARWFASTYDRMTRNLEHEIFASVRKELLFDVTEPILEIGSGTGANVPFLPELSAGHHPRRIFLERSRWMMKRFIDKGFGSKGAPVIASGSRLPFLSDAFQTVVATLVLCSVEEFEESISEIFRVLKPGGQLYSFEHVASENPWTRRAQDFMTPIWKRLAEGCHLNRETDRVLERSFRKVRGGVETRLKMPFVWGVYKKESIRGTVTGAVP
jgi:ubiquinone/menaquinone biosynthesis C-methylase UbiE